MLFFTGYLLEKSLGVDNLFVVAMIFGYFGTPAAHQHRALFRGIVGGLIMRAVMILAGAALLERFHGILYVFGALVVVTGWRWRPGTILPIRPGARSSRGRGAGCRVTEDLTDGRFIVRQEEPDRGA